MYNMLYSRLGAADSFQCVLPVSVALVPLLPLPLCIHMLAVAAARC